MWASSEVAFDMLRAKVIPRGQSEAAGRGKE
jgi:hypothetical protein